MKQNTTNKHFINRNKEKIAEFIHQVSSEKKELFFNLFGSGNLLSLRGIKYLNQSNFKEIDLEIYYFNKNKLQAFLNKYYENLFKFIKQISVFCNENELSFDFCHQAESFLFEFKNLYSYFDSYPKNSRNTNTTLLPEREYRTQISELKNNIIIIGNNRKNQKEERYFYCLSINYFLSVEALSNFLKPPESIYKDEFNDYYTYKEVRCQMRNYYKTEYEDLDMHKVIKLDFYEHLNCNNIDYTIVDCVKEAGKPIYKILNLDKYIKQDLEIDNHLDEINTILNLIWKSYGYEYLTSSPQ